MFETHSGIPLGRRLLRLPWLFLLTIALLCWLGVYSLHAIGAHNNGSSLADRQLVRVLFAFALLPPIALTPPSLWMRAAYPLYALALVLLVLVPIIGVAPPGAGARRWLAVGGVSVQPSELMKIALVLALARYYHFLPAEKISHPLYLLAPALLALAPMAPIFMQPDLGTALLLAMIGVGLLFLAGVNILYFVSGAAAAAVALPVLWANLHDYQRQRVFSFLQPERDPLGSGYHLMQSKIAIGSAGLWGKGLGKGTQSQLNFLPEKHTDFIFAMFTEEQGLFGALGLMALYALALALLMRMGLRTKSRFGRLLIGGMAITLSLYVFINMGMVTGMLPVVGVPLPLVSYGGTSILSLMFGFGVAISAYIHRPRKAKTAPRRAVFAQSLRN